VHASLSGSLSDTTADLTLKADASKSGGGALALPFLGTGAAAQSLSVTGQVAPKGNVIRLDIVGRAADLTVAGNTLPAPDFSLAVEAPRSSPLAGGSVPFGLRAETDAIRTAGGQITASASAPIVINASGTFDTTTQSVTTNAKFAIGGSVGSFDGTVAGGTLKGKASADFADLSVLSPLAGRTLGGSLSASADGTLVGPQAAFKLTATARDLDVGEPAITRLLAGETQATAVVGIKGGAVTLDDVSVAGQAVTASGSASLAPDTVSASLSGGISDLGLVVDNSSGAATFQAMISGARQQPNVDATIAVASGHLAGKPVQDASIRFTGAPSAGGWQGALALGGQLASRPLSGTANAMLDSSGALSIPDINLAIGDNKITGALVRNPSGLLSGSLNIAANDVRTLAALFLIDASGTAGKVAVTLTPNSGKQSLHATFSGSQVAYQTAATQALSGDVSVADLFGAPVISGNITGSDIAVGDFHLASVKATATAEGGTTHFTAQAQNADLNLSGSGSFMPATDGSAITIDTLTGTAYRLPVQLASPVAINLGSQTSRLSGASLALGGGTVTADGTVSPNLNLTLAATNVSAAVANGFVAGLNAEGAVSGRATITGTPATPKFAWQVAWQGLRVAATRNAGLPPLAVNANGNGDGKGTSLSATIAGLPGLSLNANGTVPFSGSGLNLAVNGTAPLALLALQSSRELRLGGDARINLALTGALSAIATNGTIDLNGATIADTDTGFGVTGASGRIVFNGHQATTQQISGQMIQGGNITIAGSVTVDGPGLPANLTARVTNGRYADGRVINTTFSANLALNGPLLGAGTLSGTLDLGRTEIQLPDRLAGTATAIPVTHVNAPPGFRPPQLRQSEAAAGTTSAGGGGLVLDVTVNGGQTILVRGFGIDSEFGGSLKLTGTLGNPNTAGAFTMSRGRIEVLGRRFDFQSGTLTFSGNLIPILAFTGTTTTSDSTVTLTVSGPANDPKISFSSTPALPEEEILARLLFNQSVGKLSPLQAAQLVDAIAQLTGAAGNGGIFARIREATGLDDLDIRQTATGGTTVGLAKRINDNLQVGVEAGSDPDSSRVTIDLNLSKNLKARAAAGQGGTGEVGLTYEREY
jgi:translocation and assembly module TamB